MLRYWTLNEKNEPEEVFGGARVWASMSRRNERVEVTNIGDASISTMFLGIGSFPTGLPFFETMIFGGPLDMYQERCRTWGEAVEQHKRAIEQHKLAVSSRGRER